MASYATGRAGGVTFDSSQQREKESSNEHGDLSERMARLAGAQCLETTPVTYHLVRFVIVVGIPLACFRRDDDLVCCRVLVWSIATELAGFGGGDGQLGDGHGLWTALWFRLTPGTLRQSPFADPWQQMGRRHLGDAILLVLVFLAAVYAIVTGRPKIFCAAYTVLCLRDYSAWCGGQGKHYHPMLLALCFDDFVSMRLIQFAHIFFSGAAKCGPWFLNVTPTMVAMAPCFPRGMRGLLFRDAKKGDATPNTLAFVVSTIGICIELFGPMLWYDEAFYEAGVVAVASMHLFIILANPLGGIGEWNFCNIFLEYWLFQKYRTRSGAAPRSRAALSAYLVASQFVAPVVGNLVPDACSYLLAIRNYTGNHPSQLFAARRSALTKLARVRGAVRLDENQPPSFDLDGLLGGLGTLARARGNTKALGWIVENFLIVGHDDYVVVSLPQFCCQTVTEIDFASPALLAELASSCDLAKDDLRSLRISSFSILPDTKGVYRCHWSVVDATSALTAPDPQRKGDGGPSRYGLFGRTTAATLWDIATSKGIIEHDLFAPSDRASTAYEVSKPSIRPTFDALGRFSTTKKLN